MAGQLTALLGEALIFCRENPGRVRRLDLGHGLQIRMYVELQEASAGIVHCLILRPAPKWPATLEVKTIMAHWPVPGQPQAGELEIETIPAGEATGGDPVNGLAWRWAERVVGA